jgi:hypothetical protein
MLVLPKLWRELLGAAVEVGIARAIRKTELQLVTAAAGPFGAGDSTGVSQRFRQDRRRRVRIAGLRPRFALYLLSASSQISAKVRLLMPLSNPS